MNGYLRKRGEKHEDFDDNDGNDNPRLDGSRDAWFSNLRSLAFHRQVLVGQCLSIVLSGSIRARDG